MLAAPTAPRMAGTMPVPSKQYHDKGLPKGRCQVFSSGRSCLHSTCHTEQLMLPHVLLCRSLYNRKDTWSGQSALSFYPPTYLNQRQNALLHLHQLLLGDLFAGRWLRYRPLPEARLGGLHRGWHTCQGPG